MNASVSEKGQVTIPVALRERLGIVAGTQLRFAIDDEGRLAVTVLPRGAGGLAGLLARPGERARSLDELDQGLTAQVRERARRPGRPPRA